MNQPATTYSYMYENMKACIWRTWRSIQQNITNEHLLSIYLTQQTCINEPD